MGGSIPSVRKRIAREIRYGERKALLLCGSFFDASGLSCVGQAYERKSSALPEGAIPLAYGLTYM
jgi:hypothetical protein